MSDTWTLLAALQWTAGFFEKQGVPSPRLDAEVLLGHVLSLPRIQLYAQYDRPLVPSERHDYRELVKRRAAGEPVQYLVGAQEFWSLPFAVERGVLIPRPDTEVLVEEAVAFAKERAAAGVPVARVADVGTGSGAIAVALAHELEGAEVFATDIADVPLRLAPANAAANGVGERVRVLRGAGLLPAWDAAERRPFQIVASNPPYIRAADYAGLMREVRDHEPREALVAGADGLDVVRALVREVATPGVLDPAGARVLIEIGDRDQAERTAEMLTNAGLSGARIRDDYAGRPRVVVAGIQTG
ncbi:MAG: peptide chain release factor N(5)-glutamine methyltransferase [Myxococcales bacterium]|nr:peptide chain release factor N(5)-glutamine methyltransferase [Myxococcales bacterium]MCB9733631.1 peptide chain release factor N(5)-glutamine methyltransferase [Deltaproteobacteria bacterium]